MMLLAALEMPVTGAYVYGDYFGRYARRGLTRQRSRDDIASTCLSPRAQLGYSRHGPRLADAIAI